MPSKTAFSVVVPAENRAALDKLCAHDAKVLAAARTKHRARLLTLGSTDRAAAALAFAADVEAWIAAGRVLPTRSAALDWGMRRILRARGLAQSLPPAPAEASLAGKRWGVGTRVTGAIATLNIRLERPFYPEPGDPLPLGEQVVRAAWHRSAEPIAQLRAWEDRFGRGGERPKAEDVRFRSGLVRQVVTTGDLVRWALAAVCDHHRSRRE